MPTAYHRICCAAIVVETGVNDTIIFREDGDPTDITATLSAGTYYVTGTLDSDDIIGALAEAMSIAPGAANSYTVTIAGPRTTTPWFRWRMTTDGTSFAFVSTGTTFPLDEIGWSTADSGSFAAVYDTDDQSTKILDVYSPGVISSVQDPSDEVNEGVYHHMRPDGSAARGRTATPVQRWPMLWEFVEDGAALERHETSREVSWQRFWRRVNDGRTIALFEGTPSETVWSATKVADGALSIEDRQRRQVERDTDGAASYRISATLVEDMT